jgi:hypothetical protein
MRRQLWNLWRRGRSGHAAEPTADELALPRPAALGQATMATSTAATTAPDGASAVQQPGAPFPEQPVLLSPSGAARPVRIGELLPARQRRWPLAIVRLPVIPKRAILAAGVCAGLAAPQIARHLATRVLLGNPQPAVRGVQGVLEITRIVYNGPLTPHAAEAISKALTAGRR